MIKKVALIPLDDRPCCLDFPKKLGSIADVEVKSPPKEIIGKYLTPGSPQKLSEWIKNVSNDVDAAVVSSDMLAFGGLVASRELKISKEQAENNLKILREIREAAPQLKIYLFSIIMRLSVTVTEETERCWRDIFEYSELIDRVELFSLPEDKKKLEDLETKIPKDILSEYLNVRKRNHEINELAVDFLKENIVDYLIFGIEDSASYGLHRSEIRTLLKRIADDNLRARSDVLCGADELSMVLFSRLLLQSKELRPKVYVEYSVPKAAETISLYEDTSIHQTVLNHIRACGASPAKVKDEAQLILFVNTPFNKQVDLFLEGPCNLDKISIEKLKNNVLHIKKLLELKKPVALTCVAYANGAMKEFVEPLLAGVDITKLASFAAWNTSGNSVGSALSQALVCFASWKNNPEAKKRNLSFLLERFIDDYAYQAIVRENIKSSIKDRVSAFNLGRYFAEVEWVIKESLCQKACEIFNEHIKGKNGIRSMKCSVSLPWPRIFETNVQIELA